MTIENSMGTEKISRLVLKTGIPLMLSLLINSLYNFVDSIFVSRVAEDALTALSLASPVQIIVSALGLGNAVGLNAAISRALGEKNREQVKKTANAAIFLAVCAWLLISAVCLLGARWYFSWQSGGNEVIAAYGRDYLSICMLFSLGQMGQWVFDRFVIASGKSHLFLFTLSAASVTNLILDPIFIFTFGLGTKGAAIATVIGQFMGLFAGILINRRWNREITFSFTLKPDPESVRTILRVGIPSVLVQVLTSFVTVIMNTILLAFSSTAVAIYGVCSRMMGLCTVGVHGINNGLIPIAAYNYGARKAGRIQDSVKWAMLYSGFIYLPILFVLEMFPDMVLRLFNASEHMMAIGIPAVRIMAVAWLVLIPGQVLAAALQGLSAPKPSMLLTMLRQAILPVLLAFLLSRTGWLPSVWLAFVAAELVCIPAAMLFWKRNWSSLRISMESASKKTTELGKDKVKMKKAMVFLAALLVICGISLAEDAVTSATLSVDRLPAVESTGSSILVVYFSTDDTIRAAAYTVAEALSADLFEIQPAEPYTTDDVNYHNRQSRTSIEQNDPQARPAIASLPEDLRRYDTVILGYPIWWGQAPRILYSFVESADLSGKTIIPFCTSGSSGAGSSASNLQKLTGGNSVWLEAKRISNGSSAEEIRAWAESLGLGREKTGMFYIHVNGTVLAVKAESNSSSEALLQLLKTGDITIAMHDYGSFEKVGSLGADIPRNDEDITTVPGDVILYQGNQVTIYYDENRWNLTRLGHIDMDQDELKSILGSGDVTVILSVNP